MTTKSKKSIFTLTSINLNKINEKYSISINFEDESQAKIKTTKLTDLEKNAVNKNIETFSFLDESKKTHKCILSMIDFSSRQNVKELNYNCFWDRNPIDGEPIGCPINYIPKQIQKTFFSQTSKDTYLIRENVMPESKIEDENIITINEDYYETDGAFCGFECCLAFIRDNKHNRMYDRSEILLTKIYNKLNNTKSMSITPAPSWRILKEYGGHINTITKFRSNFGKVDYDYNGYTQKCLPIAHLYEEKVKFF